MQLENIKLPLVPLVPLVLLVLLVILVPLVLSFPLVYFLYLLAECS